MNLTFRQLKVFVKLHDLRSFTAAAQSLHMTQSAVSKLCTELEDVVGFPLFDRTTRKVEPTDGAADLYVFATELLGTLDAASRSLSDLTSLKKGSVSIAAAPMIFYGLLCGVMAEFAQAYPNVRLEAHEISTDLAIDYVLNGKVDFGIVAMDHDDPRLLIEPVYKDLLCVACPLSHPFAGGKPVSWKQLMAENVIMLRADHNMGRIVESIMRKQKLDFSPMIEVGAVSTLLGLVKAGAGVAVAPEYAARFASTFGICMIPIRDSRKNARTLSLIRRRNARSSMAANQFIRLMRGTLPAGHERPGKRK